jgi:hypothetical protein
MTYVVGHINYGGRVISYSKNDLNIFPYQVTDDKDRKCLLSILKKFYITDIITESKFM